LQIAGRAAAKYDEIASYIAAAIKILEEDSEDDTDHEDTPTPPTFTQQLFLDSLFFRLLTFFNGEMNQEMNRVFLRIQIEAYFQCFGQEKLGPRDYLDYLKLLAKSGDNLVS